MQTSSSFHIDLILVVCLLLINAVGLQRTLFGCLLSEMKRGLLTSNAPVPFKKQRYYGSAQDNPLEEFEDVEVQEMIFPKVFPSPVTQFEFLSTKGILFKGHSRTIEMGGDTGVFTFNVKARQAKVKSKVNNCSVPTYYVDSIEKCVREELTVDMINRFYAFNVLRKPNTTIRIWHEIENSLVSIGLAVNDIYDDVVNGVVDKGKMYASPVFRDLFGGTALDPSYNETAAALRTHFPRFYEDIDSPVRNRLIEISKSNPAHLCYYATCPPEVEPVWKGGAKFVGSSTPSRKTGGTAYPWRSAPHA